MNGEELAEVIASEHGLSKAFSGRILKTALETIRGELKRGGVVRLRGFGTFRAVKSHGKVRAKFGDAEDFFKAPTARNQRTPRRF